MELKHRFFAGIAAAAVLATFFLLTPKRPSSCTGQQCGSATKSAAPSEATGMVAPRTFGPLPEGGFDRTRATLESRARAGDAEAAFRLGEVIGRCQKYQAVSDSAFARLLAGAVGALGGLRLDGERISPTDAVGLLSDAKAEMDELCGGTEAVRGSMRPADAHRWNHHAATLGHTRAMAAYADHAFSEFETAADLIDHAKEVARRRETARIMLGRALKAGEPEALRSFAMAHARGGWMQRDPVLALAHWEAYRRTAVGNGLSSAHAELFARRLHAQVDAAGRQRASELAHTILTRHFRAIAE